MHSGSGQTEQMENMSDFHAYYAVLDVKAGCSLSEIRSSYKSLIQKWHPDRFIDDLEGQKKATEKLQELNNAFHELQAYYKLHGYLPLSDYAESQSKIHSSMYEEDYAQHEKEPAQTTVQTSTYWQNTSRNTDGNSHINNLFVPSVTVVVLFGSLWLYFSEPDPSFSYPEVNTSNIEIAKPDTLTKNHDKSQNSDIKKINASPGFFTYGASLGEVISIQGPPDYIKGNIWFYGKSEIHFKDGQVVKWIHSHNNPLRARIDLGQDNIQNQKQPGK